MSLRSGLLFIVSLAFVGLGAFLATTNENAEVSRTGWMCVLFFGGCAAAGAIELLESIRPPRPLMSASALHVKTNRIRAATLGLAAALWLAVGVIGMGDSNLPKALAWLIALFGGLMALIGFGLALDGRPRIVVDSEGIADYRQLNVKARWESVYAIGIARDAGPSYLFVWLKQPNEFRRQQSWLAQLMRRPIDPLQVFDVELAGAVDDMMEAVRRFAPQRVWRERLIDPHGSRT